MIGQYAYVNDSHVADTARCYSNTQLASSRMLDQAETGGDVYIVSTSLSGYCKVLGDSAVVYSDISDHVELRGRCSIDHCILQGYQQLTSIKLIHLHMWGCIP